MTRNHVVSKAPLGRNAISRQVLALLREGCIDNHCLQRAGPRLIEYPRPISRYHE